MKETKESGGGTKNHFFLYILVPINMLPNDTSVILRKLILSIKKKCFLHYFFIALKALISTLDDDAKIKAVNETIESFILKKDDKRIVKSLTECSVVKIGVMSGDVNDQVKRKRQKNRSNICWNTYDYYLFFFYLLLDLELFSPRSMFIVQNVKSKMDKMKLC